MGMIDVSAHPIVSALGVDWHFELHLDRDLVDPQDVQETYRTEVAGCGLKTFTLPARSSVYYLVEIEGSSDTSPNLLPKSLQEGSTPIVEAYAIVLAGPSTSAASAAKSQGCADASSASLCESAASIWRFGTHVREGEARFDFHSSAPERRFLHDEVSEFLVFYVWPRRMSVLGRREFDDARKNFRRTLKAFRITVLEGSGQEDPEPSTPTSATSDEPRVAGDTGGTQAGATAEPTTEPYVHVSDSDKDVRIPCRRGKCKLPEDDYVLMHRTRPGSRATIMYKRRHNYIWRIVPRREELEAIVLQTHRRTHFGGRYFMQEVRDVYQARCETLLQILRPIRRVCVKYSDNTTLSKTAPAQTRRLRALESTSSTTREVALLKRRETLTPERGGVLRGKKISKLGERGAGARGGLRRRLGREARGA